MASAAASTTLSSQSLSPTEATSINQAERGRPATSKKRPSPVNRKSDTMIIDRDSEVVQAVDETYDEGDARAMSPRRDECEIERLGEGARQALEEQAKQLQDNLMVIIDQVDEVKSEHEKLSSGNTFLQSYIGELMQTTSKVNPASKGKNKSK